MCASEEKELTDFVFCLVEICVLEVQQLRADQDAMELKKGKW